MGSFSVLLIAVGLAMDAFAVSVASGIVIRDVRPGHAVRFGLYFGGFQFMMPVIGWYLGSYFADSIRAIDHWIAFGLLTVIGGRMIWESVRGGDECEVPGGESQEKLLATRNMIVLAVATSIDALAVGISLAVLDVNIWLSAAVIGAVAFCVSLAGIFLGKRLGCLFGKRVEILGGVILVGIGVEILIEHLFFGG